LGCSDFKNNPQKYTTPKCGSRKSSTTIFWDDEKTLVVCGCFKGTIDEFEKKVKDIHGKSKYGKEYAKQIKIMRYLIKAN